MSSGVTLSSATRANLLSLQDTADLVATTQNRLSTGKKVNSAIDNASNFFTASSLNSRSSALSTLLDGISNGIQTIQAASQGITSIQKLTAQLKSTAQQALASSNSFTTKATQASAGVTNITADNILGGTYAAASVTTSTAVNNNASTPAAITRSTVLSGSGTGDYLSGVSAGDTLTINGTAITFVSGVATAGTNQVSLGGTVGDLEDKIDSITGGTSTVTAGKLTLGTGTKQDLVVGGTASALTGLGLAAGTTARGAVTSGTNLTGNLTVKVGSGTTAQSTTVTFGANNVSTLDQLNAQLNSVGAQATIDTNGKLNITTTNEAGAEDLTLSGTATGSGKPFAAATNSAVIGGDGSTTRNQLVTDYNNLLTQIDQLSGDAGFNGVNLLSGDTVKVIFNEKNSSSVSIKGNATNSGSLGLQALGSTDFQDATKINSVLDQITSANTTLESQAATYGTNLSVVQNRQDFSKGLINILDTGAANLTDADLNEEAANSQALTTRQSLGISALSLANQSQQGILQLLR